MGEPSPEDGEAVEGRTLTFTGGLAVSTTAGNTQNPRSPVAGTMQAAEYLGLHARTLDNWRSQGRGPRYIRVGRRIVYRISDLEAYLDDRTVEGGER